MEFEDFIMEIQRLKLEIHSLNEELNRVRSVHVNSAHALDCLRQDLGLELISGEHPMDLYKRLKEKCDGTE